MNNRTYYIIRGVIMLKLDRQKKIVALVLTSTVFFPNMALSSENRMHTYVDDGKLIIYSYGNFELKISEENLENLIESGDGISFSIGDELVEVDSDELAKLKKEALENEKELNNYKIIIYTSFGAITLLVIRSKIKEFGKKKM